MGTFKHKMALISFIIAVEKRPQEKLVVVVSLI